MSTEVDAISLAICFGAAVWTWAVVYAAYAVVKLRRVS